MSNSSKIKVLSLGLSQSNFIIQLYKGILKEDKDFEFSVDGFYDLSSNVVDNDTTVFTNMFHLCSEKVSLYTLVIYFFKSLFENDFWNDLFFERLIEKRSFIETLRLAYKYVREFAIMSNHLKNNNYNIFHFHYCVPEKLTLLKFLPPNAKIICSFWGSDLLRTSGARNSYYLNKALVRSTLITTQSLELKEIVLSKYGRDLSEKIKCLTFTINQDVFNFILKQSNKDCKNAFRKQYNIDVDKKVITVGYNAKKENNHFSILEELDKLDVTLKRQLTIIIPFAYGKNQDYIVALKEEINKNKSIQTIIIEDFLSPRQVAQLRVNTDIQIQMPMSDALSASVMEVMYAKNIAICASWLPYSPYKNVGIKFLEVNDFSDLPKTLSELLPRLEEKKLDFYENQSKIENFFFPKQTSISWINLYKQL